jgi:5-formyltetrahydrofolate cyclo-ligase
MRTLPALQQQLAGNKRIVVPFCTVDDFDNRCLGLWLLEDVAELKPGMWNIQEPPRERWQEAGKILKPDELDAVIVPGVAFDQYGGRLGNGAGYYDRLLQCVRPDTVLAGVCYQSQIVSSVPMQSHDVFMNFVITEQTIYPGSRGR